MKNTEQSAMVRLMELSHDKMVEEHRKIAIAYAAMNRVYEEYKKRVQKQRKES